MVGNIEQISSIRYDLKAEFSLKKLIGKRVLSKDGEVLGKVKDIVIKQYQIIGIVISSVLKSSIFVDRIYFDSFREEAVILKINPVTSLIGLKVLDKNGRKLGKISKIVRQNTKNEFTTFYVKKNLFKDIAFNAADIDKISENVILNKEFEQ